MSDWRRRLRDADRALAVEMERDVARRMRQSVLASAREAAAAPGWSRTFVTAAATLALLCVGLLTALPRGASERPVPAVADAGDPIVSGPDDPSAARQQLQFATPGGTRIIWVFDPGFEVKGTLP